MTLNRVSYTLLLLVNANYNLFKLEIEKINDAYINNNNNNNILIYT